MLIHIAPTKTGKTTAALALSLMALFASAGCNPIQPKPKCKTQNSDYAARYDVVGNTPAACMDKVLTGEMLHVQTYYPDQGKAGATPAIGIEADSAAVAAAIEGSTGQEFSLGNYSTTEPDANDICTAPTMSDTDVMAPESMDAMMMTIPATHIVYKWSNVRALTTPASNAIYFGADLTRTVDDCTMTYHVSAVNPPVSCGDGTMMDPMTMMTVDDPTSGKPDQSKCDSDPLSGTGLSPSINYTCDEATLLCLPDAFK